MEANRETVSNKNAEFWNELCGSQLARSLGITDSSKESLKKFDDWYFAFYPYLTTHISFDRLKNKDVLEIGLGYGSVSQRLAEAGARYTGLDIAAGPVAMANHRLKQCGLPGAAVEGSILAPPFSPESFDTIVAIGCLHHTGDLKRAIDRCWSLLRPGGTLTFMVYYAYSYRRFRMTPGATLGNLSRELFGYRGVVEASSERDRAAYDASADGAGAPHTDWISVRSLRHLCNRFTEFSATIENIDREMPFVFCPRATLLKTPLPGLCGLDLYAQAHK
jgi:SAM-dependent methyltransferase